MKTHIAILRGINVGGKRKILMADLKLLFQDLGFADIETYIQSGNVVFKAPTSDKLEHLIKKAIQEKYGFEVPTIVRSLNEWEKSISTNPFLSSENEGIERMHLTFLKETPKQENIELAEAFERGNDQLSIVGKDVFLLLEGKYSQSKLSNQFFEKKLKVEATTRNWKTVKKLLEIASKN
ncbi:DUF1697 domain-containing protein [Sediminitomix flava]|uniref:Uncharacterized protein (DUF1697 family) n=1 Tax=Sediminitomix flava TaxID=379075 RepID=A0A315Z8B7_SEDFL|nr:DUF1697 domain-containing protein [Sediminitomix flava]PWJ41107.1 uncharacterized protein (DUF1697 family) [Sediminitomix flava]